MTQERPFLEIVELFLLVALFVSNIWDFMFRPSHPPSSLVVSGLVCAVFALGCRRAIKRGE
jgi:hypothetical protein